MNLVESEGEFIWQDMTGYYYVVYNYNSVDGVNELYLLICYKF